MTEKEFKERTKRYALRVIRLVERLPRNQSISVIGRQLLKSSTSVAANYRSACRARSRAEVISKLSIVAEEADESLFWMEFLIETEILPQGKLYDLMREGDELLTMTGASIKTLRASNPKS